MSKELTPWFPADVKPSRIGRYERLWPTALERSIPDYWDGSVWYCADLAGRLDSVPSTSAVQWRGLAKKP